MKKNLLFGRILCLMMTILIIGSSDLMADDVIFSQAEEHSQTLYYKVTSSVEPYTVCVTYPNRSGSYAGNAWGTYTKPTGPITIPSSVEYNNIEYSVTELDKWAFARCIGITIVTIPNTITNIGTSAFDGCSALNSITIPNSVTSISADAFSNCNGNSFTTVVIPNSVTTIGNNAFKGCSKVTTLTIGSNVTVLSSSVFSGMSSLSSIVIPNTVTTLNSSAFEGCSGATSLSVGTGITSLPQTVFKGMSNLISVTLPGNVTTINGNAFQDCSKLTTIEGPGVITLQGTPFTSCTSLTTINFPVLETISDKAFQNCSALESVYIPSTVSSISGNPFYNCTSLATITIAEENIQYFSGDGGINCIINKKGSKNLMVGCLGTIIPEGVVKINDNAFYNMKGLTAITIPSTVTTIGKNAFNGCQLTSISIPAATTTIDNYAFSGNNLSSVIINKGVTTINQYAFSNNIALTSLIIPSTVTTIGQYAFYGCSGLKSVTLLQESSVPSLGGRVFYKNYSSIIDDLVIYVPSTQVSAYEAASNWSAYASNIDDNGVIMVSGEWTSAAAGAHVCINANSTIPTNTVLDVNNVIISNDVTLTIANRASLTATKIDNYGTAANLVIADGGQLIIPSTGAKTGEGVQATFQKEITGYGDVKDNYFLIANPTTGDINPTTVSGMLTLNYDFYYFDEAEEGAEWRNYKQEEFDLENGKGYLYANSSNRTLQFSGTVPTGTTANITLSKSGSGTYAGFNLVGNPLSNNVTSMKIGESSCSYYKVNSSTGVFAVSTDPITVGEAFMVQAPSNGAILKLNQGVAKGENGFNNDVIRLEVSNSKFTDVAYVYFGNHLPLTKINHLNDEAPMLYIRNGNDDRAVEVYNNREEVNSINVCFEAKTIGQYTISANMVKGAIKYMHLIDKYTGEDIDMLVEDSYTFIGAPNDSNDRFMLRFTYDTAIEEVELNSVFVHQSGSEVIVEGEGQLQVFDMMGRMVMNQRVNGTETVNGLNNGVYVFRMNEKMQKVVIR